MVKAIIFDVFGVLITDALGPMIEALRVSNPGGAAKIDGLVAATSRNEISRQDFTEQASAILGIMPDELRTQVDAGEAKNAALLEFIKTLRPKYKIAVLSNISVGAFERRFSSAEIQEYFDVVVPSGAIGYIKPEPEAYLITAERLGAEPSECIMVDDREVCCEGAQAVGMQAIMYQSLAMLQDELSKQGIRA